MCRFRAASLLAAAILLCATAAAAPPAIDDHIKVDQFGYLPAGIKTAVVSDPQTGYNAPDPFAPAAQYEIRRWADDSVVFQGPVTPWRGGAVHAQSGDRAWWFDFSAVTAPGSYYVFDPTNNAGSVRFEIADDVYAPVLRTAARTFFYQRCGTAKDAAHAGASWADAACHRGAEQDTDCRSIADTNPATSRDLSGGWHDAGDYNKYINFADGPVHDVLSAYEDTAWIFGDETNIPESGNGVPDLLDEVERELDWFLRMQRADGSLNHKVSVTDYAAASPPSADTAPRRYAPATASATISGCGAMAHGAAVFKSLPDPVSRSYGDTLEAAARAAWAWLDANPGLIPSAYDNAGFQNAGAEDDAYSQDMNRVCASSYLYVLTGEDRFRQFFDANYSRAHLFAWTYAYPFEQEYQDCLLYYGRAPGATPAVTVDIESVYAASLSGPDNLGPYTAGDDAYRAFLNDGDYTWGSNRTKAHQGLMFLNMRLYDVDAARAADYVNAAAGFVHYMHGVNPPGLVYLSNMAALGGETSIQEFYHSWFGNGTPWDNASTSLYGPAPGFVPGGANPSYQPDASYTGPPIEPPRNQPVQKSYRDWNTTWPENSWEVTENSITYQAAYVKLLARYIREVAGPTVTDPAAVTGCEGAPIVLRVTAAGAPPLSFAWRKDGAPLSDGGSITGSRTDTLRIDPASAADAGSYDVVVTDAASRSAVSTAAALAVETPPQTPGNSLRAVSTPGQVALTWAACAGADTYHVQRCDASTGPCTPQDLGSTGVTAFADTPGAEAILWYKLEAANACGRVP